MDDFICENGSVCRLIIIEKSGVWVTLKPLYEIKDKKIK